MTPERNETKGTAVDAYMYRAALYCEGCAHDLTAGCSHVSELDCDSDQCPQGPYANGGGEFLENPLTADGIAYVRGIIAESAYDLSPWDGIEDWRTFYADALTA